MDELTEILSKAFLENDDEHVENIIDEIENIEIIKEIDSEWSDEGKYSYGDLTFLIKYKKENFVIGVAQNRSGSYFTDYYYSNPELYSVLTEKEYNKPKVLTKFTFRDSLIEILDDKTTQVNNIIYATTEEAINSLL